MEATSDESVLSDTSKITFTANKGQTEDIKASLVFTSSEGFGDIRTAKRFECTKPPLKSTGVRKSYFDPLE